MENLGLIIPASIIIFIAFYTRSLFGFGGALISIPLLAFIFDLRVAVPMEAIFEVLLSLVLIRSEYKKAKWKILVPIIIGAAIGTIIGTSFLQSFTDVTLQRILGVLIILFSLNLLRKPLSNTKPFRSVVGTLAGSIGGVLGAMFGTSGPPFVLYLAYQIKEKDVLRASLIGLFTIDFSWRLVVFLASGLITTEVLTYTLYLLPALLLGTILGSLTFFKTKIDEGRYKQLIAILLTVAGILLILK